VSDSLASSSSLSSTYHQQGLMQEERMRTLSNCRILKQQ